MGKGGKGSAGGKGGGSKGSAGGTTKGGGGTAGFPSTTDKPSGKGRDNNPPGK